MYRLIFFYKKNFFILFPRLFQIQPLFSLLFQSTFSQNFLFHAVAYALSNWLLLLGGLSILEEQVSPCNTKTRFAAFCITGLT